jgi:hypothetical protein
MISLCFQIENETEGQHFETVSDIQGNRKRHLTTLTLSGRMPIYNQHGDSASMDKCRYMIDKVSFAFLQ